MMHWERNQYGGDVTQYLVEAGTAPGLANIATIPVGVPAFTFDGVPPGTFFLRVRAVNAAGVSGPSNEVMVVVGTGPPGRPYGLGAVVTGASVAITWSQPAEPTTGYALEAGSAPGLSNVAVATLGPQTSVAFAGVPPGRYYVRVRALNGLGAGLTSEEVSVVVQ
jgi:predicted phage tail protein